MMRTIGLLLICCIGYLWAGEGSVFVSSSRTGAFVYVDGKKAGAITDMPLLLRLSEGRHELTVSHILDEEWQEVQRKVVTVKSNTGMKLFFSLDLEKISQKSNRASAADFQNKGAFVIDTKRDLLWQDDPLVTEVKKTWQDASEYCRKRQRQEGVLWRLPTYDELITIVDYTKHTMAVMPAFKHIISENYWTASEDEKDKDRVKTIYFGNGCPDTAAKNTANYVRCVRNK